MTLVIDVYGQVYNTWQSDYYTISIAVLQNPCELVNLNSYDLDDVDFIKTPAVLTETYLIIYWNQTYES